MRRHLVLAAAWVVTVSAWGLAGESSWVFRRSYYSHDPASGKRVNQFVPEQPAYVRTDPTYQQSAYRHTRTAVRVGEGYDYLHMVETWGAGDRIRPYGEWLYPYRAGATPFGPWGNPSGPWTAPYGAWVNPYGLGRLPHPPWYPWWPAPYVPPAVLAPSVPSGSGSTSPATATPSDGG